MKKILAIDLGATSGKGVIAYNNGKTIHTREVLSFSHNIVTKDSRNRWEWEKIMSNIVKTILDNDISSIGIDTWGVDFGILDDKGELLEEPMSYRDSLNEDAFNIAKEQKQIDFKRIFGETGNQLMPINSLFQLYSIQIFNKELYKEINKFLLMPDLINYYLTGEMYAEESILSTSQLYNLKERKISNWIIEKFNIDLGIFSDIIKAGNIVGNTRNSKIDELRHRNIDVISVASHDTASAVLAADVFDNDNTIFISSGTWSLVGCLTEEPILSDVVLEHGISNEIGYDSKNMLLKNLTGLYILEKLLDELEDRNGYRYRYDEVSRGIYSSEENLPHIDVEDPVYARHDTRIINTISREYGLYNDFDYFKIIYQSLAMKYKETIKIIEKILNKKFKNIHIVGGGAKSDVLCQLTADYTGLSVKAGPSEATIYGNIIVQMMALGEIKTLEEAMKLIRNSTKIYQYKPR